MLQYRLPIIKDQTLASWNADVCHGDKSHWRHDTEITTTALNGAVVRRMHCNFQTLQYTIYLWTVLVHASVRVTNYVVQKNHLPKQLTGACCGMVRKYWLCKFMWILSTMFHTNQSLLITGCKWEPATEINAAHNFALSVTHNFTSQTRQTYVWVNLSVFPAQRISVQDVSVSLVCQALLVLGSCFTFGCVAICRKVMTASRGWLPSTGNAFRKCSQDTQANMRPHFSFLVCPSGGAHQSPRVTRLSCVAFFANRITAEITRQMLQANNGQQEINESEAKLRI